PMSAGPGANGDAVGDAVEPIADRRLPADGPGFADEDQKRGLERVIDVGGLGQDMADGREYQLAMSPDQCSERGLVAAAAVALQQLAVGQRAGVNGFSGSANVPQSRVESLRSHGRVPRSRNRLRV